MRIGRGLAKPIGQGVQALLDPFVIIVAQGVAGDSALGSRILGIGFAQGDVIIHGHADHAQGLREIGGRIGALAESIGEILHGAGLAVVEPLAEIVAVAGRLGGGDAGPVEA